MKWLLFVGAPIVAVTLALAMLVSALTTPGIIEVHNQHCVTVPVDPTLTDGLEGDPVTGGEGGVGFPLPPAGEPRKASLRNPPQPIPEDVRALYAQAANIYKLPWTLLAGIGMAETNHGRLKATSSAGAQGLMQFMPATFAAYGVDGNGDGVRDIWNDADSIHSAANYLTASGVTKGEEGVRKALFAYNRAWWYVNDVLTYAHAYGGGTVLGDPTDCGPGLGEGDPNLPELTDERTQRMFAYGRTEIGDRYILGANGPDAWDCSSFSQAMFRSIGIQIPRTARAQRDWLAKGNGFRVQPGHERPGDFVFTNTWLGPNIVGHVMVVYNPTTHTSLEAQSKGVGFYTYSVWSKRNIYEIWRLGNLAPEGDAQ